MNYPPGVTGREPHFHEDDDGLLCANCEHPRSEHTGIGDSCMAGDDPDRICTCQEFVPEGAY